MDENNRVHAAPSSKTHPPRQQYVPYQRNVHHITQDPIVDDSVAHAAPSGPGTQAGTVPQPGVTIPPAQPMQAGQPAPMAQSAPAEPYYEPPISAGQPRGAMPGRKHMGVATSDPQYLQPAGAVSGRASGPAHPRHKNPGDGEPQTLHGNRYLSTPSSHKTIFTARQDRARKRIRVLLVVLLLVVIAVVVWLIFFH